MKTPGYALITLAIFQIPLSGALTLGWLGLPRLGVAGTGRAAAISYAIAALWILRPSCRAALPYACAGRRMVSIGPPSPHPEGRRHLLRRGGIDQCRVLVVTGLIGRAGDAAIAGYGVGSRLEYLFSPLTFASARHSPPWSAPTRARLPVRAARRVAGPAR